MICTSKNTFTIVHEKDEKKFDINIVKYLVGPVSKRYNYFSILRMEGVSVLKYDGNQYIANYDIKIKINDINKAIEVEKIDQTTTVNLTIFFGYSDEVEFSP